MSALSPLAEQIVDAATKALADQDSAPHSARVLREYRSDATAVAVAVLIRLAGRKGYAGLDKGHSPCAPEILRLANEIDEARTVEMGL